MDNSLAHRTHPTPNGSVHYWCTATPRADVPWLVFLPGLTADHHLFDPQLDYFAGTFNCLTWDAPHHGESRPFAGDFTLDDFASILHEILHCENATHPVLIGQSLGGYVSQVYMELYPGEAAAFVSIDSCSLQRRYYTRFDMWGFNHTYGMYMAFPWKTLVRLGSSGNATTETGRAYMEQVMLSFEKREYCVLADRGFKALGNAVAAGRPYIIDCPVLLLIGEKDGAGSAKRYGRRWAQQEGYLLVWVPDAGHNSNRDRPDFVNETIEAFVAGAS